MKRRVAITGMGIISSIGRDLDEFWKNCLAGKSAVATIPEQWFDYADYQSTIWAPLPEIDFERYGLSRTERMQRDPSSLMAICTAFQALDDANLTYELTDLRRNTYRIKDIDGSLAGVFMGTGIGGIHSLLSSYTYQLLAKHKRSLERLPRLSNRNARSIIDSMGKTMRAPKRFHPFTVPMMMPNACSSTLGIKFSLHGPNNTFTSACAAGTVAIGHGLRAIQAGRVDVALTGGVEFLTDDHGGIFRGYDAARVLVTDCEDPERANRPFDMRRSGFLFSQGGAAVLILEEWGHAHERGATIYAELAGYAETLDAYDLMMLEQSGQYIEQAIIQALDDARLVPEEVDYVNAHGTGTQLNDEVETAVLEKIFGSKRVLVNSTKSLIGHTIGASGAIEAVVSVLSIKHGTTHVCKNLEQPVRDLNFVTVVEPHVIQTAISQSFAFGGHNAVLVVKGST